MLLFAAQALAGAQESPALGAPAPDKPGPYPVGVTTMLFVDHARTDAYTKGPRSLMTEIWYPATDDTRGLPKNKLSDFFLKGANPAFAVVIKLAFNADMEQADRNFQNMAVRDARVRDGVFPLVLFSHGNGGMRFQNAFWCEHLASHGYIVAAPDHTGNCCITSIDGNLFMFNDNQEGREQSAEDRPKDIRFLIDVMDRLNKGGDSRFLGKIDLEHIAVAGHSFGGYTSTLVADTEPRVDCIVPMAGVARTREKYDCPAMVLVATEDDTINLEGNERVRKYYEDSTAPRYMVEFVNAGHYSFTEMYQFNPAFGDGVGTGTRITNGDPVTYIPMEKAFTLTNGYTTAFIGRYLKGIDTYDAYLAANHDPDELIVKFDVPKPPAVTETQ
jgi:dienelactone hydrolase